VVPVGATLVVVVVVEPFMLPTGVGADVGGRPTAGGAGGADADAAGWWGEKDAPSGTMVEHYRMGLS
jgi:hypothetical protein